MYLPRRVNYFESVSVYPCICTDTYFLFCKIRSVKIEEHITKRSYENQKNEQTKKKQNSICWMSSSEWKNKSNNCRKKNNWWIAILLYTTTFVGAASLPMDSRKVFQNKLFFSRYRNWSFDVSPCYREGLYSKQGDAYTNNDVILSGACMYTYFELWERHTGFCLKKSSRAAVVTSIEYSTCETFQCVSLTNWLRASFLYIVQWFSFLLVFITSFFVSQYSLVTNASMCKRLLQS